jgi:hypothetical protein
MYVFDRSSTIGCAHGEDPPLRQSSKVDAGIGIIPGKHEPDARVAVGTRHHAAAAASKLAQVAGSVLLARPPAME